MFKFIFFLSCFFLTGVFAQTLSNIDFFAESKKVVITTKIMIYMKTRVFIFIGVCSFIFTQIAPKIDFEFVVVLVGTFTMGSVDKGSLISVKEEKEKKLDFEWLGL